MKEFDTLAVAGAGMNAQSARLRLVSENIANADTPGYRRKIAPFEVGGADGMVELGRVRLDQSPLRDLFDPSHPMAGDNGHVAMSNVTLVSEIADAREAQRGFEANMAIFEQARRMYSDALELLKR